MDYLSFIKRPFIWISRFRHRCGYGVHSPSAFEFITGLIYEKLPYYAYEEIESINSLTFRRKKINRLLFRLTNRFQPATVLNIGPTTKAMLYIQAAKKNITCLSCSSPKEIPLSFNADFIYIHNNHIGLIEKFLCQYISHIKNNSFIVIEGIKNNKKSKSIWDNIISDNRVIVSFDLYDIGILFFDKSKLKQNYKVNF